jgi:hypothetical protein
VILVDAVPLAILRVLLEACYLCGMWVLWGSVLFSCRKELQRRQKWSGYGCRRRTWYAAEIRGKTRFISDQCSANMRMSEADRDAWSIAKVVVLDTGMEGQKVLAYLKYAMSSTKKVTVGTPVWRSIRAGVTGLLWADALSGCGGKGRVKMDRVSECMISKTVRGPQVRVIGGWLGKREAEEQLFEVL